MVKRNLKYSAHDEDNVMVVSLKHVTWISALKSRILVDLSCICKWTRGT